MFKYNFVKYIFKQVLTFKRAYRTGLNFGNFQMI